MNRNTYIDSSETKVFYMFVGLVVLGLVLGFLFFQVGRLYELNNIVTQKYQKVIVVEGHNAI